MVRANTIIIILKKWGVAKTMNLITNTLSTKLLLSLVLLMFLSVANADRDEDTLVLDVDASGTVTPFTDGLMILRFISGSACPNFEGGQSLRGIEVSN